MPAILPTATILNGTALSQPISLADHLLCGIIIPAAWTAANLTLQASDAIDGTFGDVYDSGGTEKSITVGAAGRTILLNPSDFAGFAFVRFRSGTAAAPVNQGAARDLKLVLRAA